MKASPAFPLLRCLCWLLLGIALSFASVAPSQARMGGGHSYSSGSSSRSSSSGTSGRSSGSSRSGGGSWGGTSSSSGFSSHSYGGFTSSGSYSGSGEGSPTLLIEIIALLVVIYILWRLLSQGGVSIPTQTFQSSPASRPADPNATLDQRLRDLLSRDENFSKVLFLDFACLLYHKLYTYRGTGQFKQLSPYLSKRLCDEIASNTSPSQRVHGIVIGKARLANITAQDGQDLITVEFEANMSLRYATGEQIRLANRERWTFGRQQGVLSPQPAQMRALSCPSCGAPADFTDAGECQYCHSFIQAGEKQWQVASLKLINTEPLKIEDPGAYVQETGTALPTLTQPGLQAQERQFVENHGLADWTGFFNGFSEKVVKPYFLATYAAWSKGQWHLARHLVSDRLYESNGFWMQEYARQGWQNRLDGIQVGEIRVARLDLDKFYESITVRVFASCLDYTVDKQGKLIGGSDKKPRKFSEYWTFIRTAGVEKIEAGYDLTSCPSCGAPADKIGQAGECGYCGSKLTEGHFSWILALITQDEVYEG